MDKLREREREILVLLCQGLPNKEITGSPGRLSRCNSSTAAVI